MLAQELFIMLHGLDWLAKTANVLMLTKVQRGSNSFIYFGNFVMQQRPNVVPSRNDDYSILGFDWYANGVMPIKVQRCINVETTII